jgi:hypothetical protein
MKVIDQHTQQQITDLVNACAGYWELRGIAQDRRNEMWLELEQHLQQAVSDGKSLEAVVGSNPLTFAESWARETPHHFSRGSTIVLRWVVYNWLAYLLAFFGGIALFEHLILRSPTFPFTIAHLLVIAFLALFGLLEITTGFFAPRIRSREKRSLLVFTIYALICVLLLVILPLAGVQLKTTLFSWSWPITVLLIIAAAGVFWLKSRFSREKRHERQSLTI